MKLCPLHGIHNESRCPKCKTESNKTYDRFSRDKTLHKFYNSKAWKTARKMQLSINPLCVSCGYPATLVDHIKEVRDGGDKLHQDNLQSMCKSCHNTKTAEEKRQRGGG